MSATRRGVHWLNLPSGRMSAFGVLALGALIATVQVLPAIVYFSGRSVDGVVVLITATAGTCGIAALVAGQLVSIRKIRAGQTEGARMQAIMTSMRDGVCSFDDAGRLNYMNAAAERMLGRRFEDYAGAAWAAVFPLTHREGDTAGEGTLLSRVLAGTPYAGRDAVERQDGAVVLVDVRMASIVIPGQHGGAVLVFADDTERSREEQAKDDFVGFASHELRSPLTAMHGFSSWLAKKLEREPWQFDTDTAEAIAALASETGRMESIIELFLDLTQIRMDRLSLEPSLIDVAKLVREEASAARSRYPAAALEESLPTARVLAILDEQRLRQIVLNLLDNAAKYGGAHPRIAVSLIASSGIVELRVRDSGSGIPREDQQHIFERFFRSAAPATGRKQGFGIGLYVTKQIVDRMGGELFFTSREAEGTEFTLRLPLMLEEMRAAAEEAVVEEREFAGRPSR